MFAAISARIFKEPVSASTHFFAMLMAFVGTYYLLTQVADSPAKTLAFSIYAFGLIGVFFASSIYHFFDFGDAANRWLQRLDHGAIFVMIAGSYVPMLVHYLTGAWRFWMLVAVGVIAVAGIVFKTLWIDAPTWLGTGMYLAMGWLVIIPSRQLFPEIGANVLTWMVIGGLAYTFGAFIYAMKRPDPWPLVFGHHEIWHLFVMGGAGAHFVAMVHILPVPIPL